MMRKTNKIGILAASLLMASQMYAGNPQRSGSAGASELLINPWARTSGWASVNVAGVKGVQASFLNIAGTAQTERTSVAFNNTQWLVGTDVNINAFGFTQKVGASGVLGANITAFDYGEIERTTSANPDGGIGSFEPSTVNIGVSYAQRFTESILGGVNIKLYSQTTQNLSVNALCFDAGVQYITGENDQIKFGITLQNVGPGTAYEGDGKSVVLTVPDGTYQQAYNERSANFELPTTLSIGGSYDFEFTSQRLTLAGAFQSNSFQKDEYRLGAEYAYNELVMARAGYILFDNRINDATTSALSGFTAGLSVDVPLGESTFMLDYSYLTTNWFDGIHSMGVSFNL